MSSGSAPGKAILFGEHAVVYGRPALAVPVSDLRARAEVQPRDQAGIWISAPQVEQEFLLEEVAADHALRRAVEITLEALGAEPSPLQLRVVSELPIAAGLGSGAAVSVAIIRALSAHHDRELAPERQSELAFEVEKLHHGSPSGIDNTVIAFGQAVSFLRGAPPRLLELAGALHLVIGDSGHPSPTADAVAGVLDRRNRNRSRYEALFDEIADISVRGRSALEAGEPNELGPLMDQNHDCLRRMRVSTPELDRLVRAARDAGALGAKLTGAGLGGVMLALVEPEDGERVAAALSAAGAARTYQTEVRP